MIPPQSPCVLDSDKYRCNETDSEMKLMNEFRRMSIMSEALLSSPPRRRTQTQNVLQLQQSLCPVDQHDRPARRHLVHKRGVVLPMTVELLLVRNLRCRRQNPAYWCPLLDDQDVHAESSFSGTVPKNVECLFTSTGTANDAVSSMSLSRQWTAETALPVRSFTARLSMVANLRRLTVSYFPLNFR